MSKYLADDLGAKAAEFTDCWREKQLKYIDLPAALGNGATLFENPVNDRTFSQPDTRIGKEFK